MKNKRMIYLQITLMALLFVSCKTQLTGNEKEIVLTNTSNLELADQPISIARSLLPVREGVFNYPLLIHKTDTIPSQLNDLDGDGNWDELFLVANFSAKEKKKTRLVWVKEAPKFTIRTSVRFGKREAVNEPLQPATSETINANQVYKKLGFQKYQTDGPSWENDKVGFRHYLDGRNAKDVFGKKIPGITPENVGINSAGAVEDNYHVMYDWGRDIFPVGSSAGLGGYALLVGNEISRLGILGNDTLNNIEKTTFKIVSEGPVNSVLNYEYHNWKASGNLYQVKETTSIWPGMYGYKNTIRLDGLKGNEMLLVALSNINNRNPLSVVEAGNWVCLIQHDYLTYERKWILGTAILVPKNSFKGYIEAPKKGQLTDSYLAKLAVENNKPISYYAIAGWELSADKNFSDAAYFKNYVTSLARQLSTEISVTVNN